MADPIGVSLALDDGPLAASPTWTRFDDTDNLIASYTIRRGRVGELEKTGTGTAGIAVNDTAGLLDPTNTGSPYFGELDGKQAAIALHNPVTDAWSTIFRGDIDDYGHNMDGSQLVDRVGISLVDKLDFLAGVQMQPDGSFGDPVPDASLGSVFFEDTAGTVDDRIFQVLGNTAILQGLSDWPPELMTIFSGNVSVQETVYSAGSSVLQVLQDCADAEFPGVANIYVSRDGKVTFHGRLARFYPDEVAAGATPGAWNFTRWKAGDGAAILADSANAQIRGLSFRRSRKDIINSYLAYPQGIMDADLAGQQVQDSTSQIAYGFRGQEAPNLVTLHDVLNDLAANAATKLFATYYVDNFKDPRTRVEQIVFRSLHPDDDRAAATWALICGVEISDIVHLKTTHPGGGGFDEDFYVEGITYDVKPANPLFPDVTLTLDVSPAARFDTNPFGNPFA